MDTENTAPAGSTQADETTDKTTDEPQYRLANTGKALRFAIQLTTEKQLTQVAASLTFTTILAIVPLLAVVLALFTAFPLFADFRVALENFLTVNLMPTAISENVMGYLNKFAAQASGLTVIGTLFLIVTSLMLMMTIDEAFNNIWHVEQQRPLAQRLLVYWAILSLGPILGGASLWATFYIAQESLQRLGEISIIANIAQALIPLLITGLGFTALYLYVPNRKVYWRDALAGGFCTAVILAVMRAGFAFYLSRFPSYTIIYGAFATVPIFLLWLYLSWMGILFGATVAATLPLLRLHRWTQNRRRGAMFVDAVQIIRLLHRARACNPPGRSMGFLGSHLRLQYGELLSVLETLKDMGYVVCAQEKRDDQWVLACDPRQASLNPLIDALLIDRHQPGLAGDGVLINAISVSLKQDDATCLEDVLENDQLLPQTAPVGQNTVKQS